MDSTWKPMAKRNDDSSTQPAEEDTRSFQHPRVTVRHRLPPTQDSQGSSSTGSGATGMSLGTSGGSVSSGKSAKQPGKSGGAGRGTRCSSSASSSTEETEARERRFGSLDLHPLPTVGSSTAMASAVRRSLIGSGAHCPHHLHYNALLTMHQRFVSHTEGPADSLDCHSSQPSVPTVNTPAGYPGPETEPAALSAASLANKSEIEPSMTATKSISTAVQNPMRLFGVLPPSLWPCLLCPLHGASLANSSALLMAEIEQGASTTVPNKDDPAALLTDATAMRDSNASSGLDQSAALTYSSVSTEPNSTMSSSSVADKWFDSGSASSHPAPHIGPYQLGPTLGRGNFAVVKLAKHIPTKMKALFKRLIVIEFTFIYMFNFTIDVSIA
ncbi:unnamed protein product [Echinostoma caproni]|uniref:Protein kinase domain-containing protein n=1 Tax=Echinostoma caproni TaxID=27848 RepID=A0A183AWR1_9TREM|nr:unnamed protein product [Echinostoma caproni]